MSDNPAVRSILTTCCLVSCTAITELSLLCEIAVSILSSSPASARAGPAVTLKRDPLSRGSVARLVRLVTVEMGTIATQMHADLVVVGASEHLGHRIVGSLAGRLVRAGKWPVTVVP